MADVLVHNLHQYRWRTHDGNHHPPTATHLLRTKCEQTFLSVLVLVL